MKIGVCVYISSDVLLPGMAQGTRVRAPGGPSGSERVNRHPAGVPAAPPAGAVSCIPSCLLLYRSRSVSHSRPLKASLNDAATSTFQDRDAISSWSQRFLLKMSR